jgi:hypothetical protein
MNDDDEWSSPVQEEPQRHSSSTSAGANRIFNEEASSFFDGADGGSHYRGAYRCLGSELRGGVLRTVRCSEAVSWLQQQGALPRRCHVVTSLPDIGELKPRLAPAEYEEWFTEVVRLLLSALDPHSVAIFYQTDGRSSGVDGTYLDKSYLCHRGAQAAGAACLFHRIVCAGPLGLARGAHVRPSYAHLQCFSRALRPPRGAMQWSDVLPTRGHMSYAGAMGEAACAEALAFVVGAERLRPRTARAEVSAEVSAEEEGCAAATTTSTAAVAETEAGREVGTSSEASALAAAAAAAAAAGTLLPECESDAPALVLDPFVGHGSVLAMANAWGLDALGIDINPMRCASSLTHRLRSGATGGESMVEVRGTAPAEPPSRSCSCDGDHPHCRTS